MKKNVIIAGVIIVSFILGVYSGPAIHTTEKHSSQKKTVQNNTETQKNKVVDEIIVKRPDGTVETKRRIVSDTKVKSKKRVKTKNKTSEKVSKQNLPNNQITLMYEPKSIPDYGIMYQRRIFSSLYVGGYVRNDSIAPKFGVSVTLGF